MATKKRPKKMLTQNQVPLETRLKKIEHDITVLADVLIGLRDQLVKTIFTPDLPDLPNRPVVKSVSPFSRGLAGGRC